MSDINVLFQEFQETIENYDDKYTEDIQKDSFFGFPMVPILEAETRLKDSLKKNMAYLSMEYGLASSIYRPFQSTKNRVADNECSVYEVFSNQWVVDYLYKLKIKKALDMPIYSGGLGVLAGDSMKSFADLRVSAFGMGILWSKGYFKQSLWYQYGQVSQEVQWDPHSYPGLIPLKNRIDIPTKEGPIVLRLWKYYVYSFDKSFVVPLVLLDANIDENEEKFRSLTDQLYRSDGIRWQIYQRLILGLGVSRVIKELSYDINYFHLNEGHAAFAIVDQYMQSEDKDIEVLKKNFVYTCHTPVAAGHDRFQNNDLAKYLTDEYVEVSSQFGKEKEGGDFINLTYLSLNMAGRFNAVAQKHGDIMRLQFPKFADRIYAVTNGIHLSTWMTKPIEDLLDSYRDEIGDWRKDASLLVNVDSLKNNENFRRDLFDRHQENKKCLMDHLSSWQLKEDVLTISWARRMTGYKRPDLLFYDVDRIIKLAEQYGGLQIIFSGKAHPNDDVGSARIDDILNHINKLNMSKNLIKVFMIDNYDTYLGKLLTGSVDVWLNNPLPPFEASGTSGMKAIANGVLQLSSLDGWVVEAEKDDIGWIFGYRHEGNDIGDENDLRLESDSGELYDALEKVMKLYYQTYNKGVLDTKSLWIDKMIHCIKCSAFFNTERMVKEYQNVMWQ